jgi:integrase
MKGAIRTFQKCPKCGGSFSKSEQGFECPSCLTLPTRYVVDIHWRGQRLRIYSDRDGHPLDSYRRAVRLIEGIRHQIDEHRFDPSYYIKTSIKAYRFDNYLTVWLKDMERRKKQGKISPAHLQMVESVTRLYIKPWFGGMDMREIRSTDIKYFANDLPDRLSLGYQKLILAILRKILKDAKIDGYINTVPRIPTIDVPVKYKKWVDEETQDRILERIPDKDKPIFMFMMRQGVRPAEARALQWHDIDFERDMIVIRRSFSMDECREYTKNKDIRIIPLDHDVREMLLSMPIPLKKQDFVFKHKGKAYTRCRTADVWRKTVRDMGLNDVTLAGGTRHSVASQAANRGVDYRTIGKLLGHKNPKVTERYAQLNVDSLRKALRVPDENRLRTVCEENSNQAKLLIYKGNNE